MIIHGVAGLVQEPANAENSEKEKVMESGEDLTMTEERGARDEGQMARLAIEKLILQFN